MSTTIRGIFKRKPSVPEAQDPTDSWSLETFRKEYNRLVAEIETLRETADGDRQSAFAGRQKALNAEHEITELRRRLGLARTAFKDLESDLDNGIDIDRCRRVVKESKVPSHQKTEVQNELKRLRATVNGMKIRLKGLAGEIKEHLK
ncbi:hypothetical protein ACHAPA_000841 [Fusarium lateritium]